MPRKNDRNGDLPAVTATTDRLDAVTCRKWRLRHCFDGGKLTLGRGKKTSFVGWARKKILRRECSTLPENVSTKNKERELIPLRTEQQQQQLSYTALSLSLSISLSLSLSYAHTHTHARTLSFLCSLFVLPSLTVGSAGSLGLRRALSHRRHHLLRLHLRVRHRLGAPRQGVGMN